MNEPRPPRAFLARPPFVIVAIGLAVCTAMGLGWAAPEFWGQWRSNAWNHQVRSHGEPPLLAADGALLPDSQSVAIAAQCSRARPAVIRRAWTPTTLQLRQLEADLAPVLQAIDDTLSRFPGTKDAPLRMYRRQYAGLELETGERIIYVNAFNPSELAWWASDGRDTTVWRHKPVNVCDGWRGYWGIEYDPASRRFRGFSFNGQA